MYKQDHDCMGAEDLTGLSSHPAWSHILGADVLLTVRICSQKCPHALPVPCQVGRLTTIARLALLASMSRDFGRTNYHSASILQHSSCNWLVLQACSHLPDTGVADEATWKALLGAGAQPNDIMLLHSGNEDDVDMTEETADRGVWLVGEQRFSKRRV